MESKKGLTQTNPKKINQVIDANQEMDRRFYEGGEKPVLDFIIDRGIPPIPEED